MLAYRDSNPEALSEAIHGYLKKLDTLTIADYRRALARRAELVRAHRALVGRVDGFITLAHIGPGQVGFPPVGTPWYNDPSSTIGAPSLNLPLLSVEGVPLGVQIMGFEHEDERLFAVSRWLIEQFGSTASGQA
jgi:Asp-tRNA(Asn)/Glu-tRNA(Gln) amidotransferase A subunit family amidase